MIRKAMAKMTTGIEQGAALFCGATAVALPFPAAYFDGVLITQVLHHLGDKIGSGFPMHRQVLSEIARVLKPQGKVVISTCSQEQLHYSYWYYALVPRAAREIARRYAPLDDLEQILEEVGFLCCGRFVPTKEVLQGASYYDPRGPLDEWWRDGDSVWAFVGCEELEEVTGRIRSLVAEDKMTDYFEEHDAKRLSLGQITFVQAIRR
jgi:SAM-dependent methyltransferase